MELRNSTTRGSKKREANVSTEGRKDRILPELMEGISLQRQLAKIEEVDCYFKCDDSNTRLQRSNLQVTYLKDSGDLQVTR